MKRRIFYSFAMVLGWMLIQSPALYAADKKPLKEMLFEKGVLTKNEASMVQDTKLSNAIDRIIFSGDFRLRHESFMKDHDSVDVFDRHRQRFRLRVGSEIKVSDYTVMVRLASGGGEAVSTNQSFDNLFTQKQIWIDQAFLKWQGGDSRWLALAGGRMQNPFWRVYSTDIVFDDDLNPEGFAEMMTWKPAGETTVFVNLGQFVLDEDSGDNNDQWLFGQQVGATFVPVNDLKTTLAVAYYDATNVRKGTLSSNPNQTGNTENNAAGTTCPSAVAGAGVLCNDYNVVDVTAQAATKVGGMPLTIMGDFIQNLADPDDGSGNKTGETGYQAGFILGKASDPQTWEFAYFYKMVETDATLADLSDSDFGDGGINRKGHIVWVAYNPTKFLQGKVKYFTTEVETAASPSVSADADINRVQADLSIKF